MSKPAEIGEKIKDFATGSNAQNFTRITYPFDMYEIVVKLTLDGKFVGIEEVRINKDFRDYRNKTEQSIFAEIEEIPTEPEQK